jgi:predicted small lipoprotein YifL
MPLIRLVIILKRLLVLMILILSIVAFTACESKGPAEKAGEKIDEAVQKTTDKAEEITDAVKDKAGISRERGKKSQQSKS